MRSSNLIILFLLSISSRSIGQGVNANCPHVIDQLVAFDHANPLLVEVVTDSVRLDWEIQSAVHYYRKDSTGTRTGSSATYYFDGYVMRGQYEGGLREGVWILYNCSKEMRIVDQYHYEQGKVVGVVTKRKLKKRKLSSIPLIY